MDVETPNRSETARESPCLYTFSRRFRPVFAIILHPLNVKQKFYAIIDVLSFSFKYISIIELVNVCF